MGRTTSVNVKSGRIVRPRGPGIHMTAGKSNFAGTESFDAITQLFKVAIKRQRGMKTHVWRPIGEKIIQHRIKQRFRTGGLADGDSLSERWKPLSEVTRMIRREDKRTGSDVKNWAQPIKRKTLKLQKSTKYWKGQGKRIVRVGSFLDYASFQEFGGFIKPHIDKTRTDMSEDDEHNFYYITGRDDTGKRVRIRLPQMTTVVEPRPGIYMNRLMIRETEEVLSNYIIRSFEDGQSYVDNILGKVPF